MGIIHNPDAQHTGLITVGIVTVTFCIPLIFFFFKKFYFPMLLYSVCLVFVFVLALVNVKYIKEINTKEWDNFYNWIDNAKKYLKPVTKNLKQRG